MQKLEVASQGEANAAAVARSAYVLLTRIDESPNGTFALNLATD